MLDARDRREVTLIGAATAALAVGLLVYLVDRPAGTAWLMPQAGALRGPAGLAGAASWLPSAVHAFAFALLSALLLPPRMPLYPVACAGWVLVDGLFELGQHPGIAAGLSEWLQDALPPGLAQPLARYFLAGTFDPADLGAVLLGGAAAWALLCRTHVEPETAHAP